MRKLILASTVGFLLVASAIGVAAKENTASEGTALCAEQTDGTAALEQGSTTDSLSAENLDEQLNEGTADTNATLKESDGDNGNESISTENVNVESESTDGVQTESGNGEHKTSDSCSHNDAAASTDTGNKSQTESGNKNE